MELVLEAVLWVLLELLFQLAAEVLISLGFASIAESVIGQRDEPHWAMAPLGCILAGGITGLIVTLIYPHHVSPTVSLPYFAIVILPLLVGATVFWLGSRAEAAGRRRPILATFWGGVLFGLGLSVTRFLILRGGWRLTGA